MPTSTTDPDTAATPATDAPVVATASAEPGAVTGVLLRFVSCGLLSLACGILWKVTLAPSQVGVGSALLGILCLLSGFVVGGLLWYLRDARLRSRQPERVSDERLIFSFIVFAMIPFAVGVLVGLVWLLALVIGGR